MTRFLTGMWLIATLELRQRVRGVSWYILIGVFVLMVALVTVLMWLATSASGESGGWIYSTLVYFVLLLGTLVTPALSGNAINGERDSGTLATTQVTLISTTQLVIGKFVAAWIMSLTFLVASLPFLIFAVTRGSMPTSTVGVSVLVLAAELAVVAAIGVGLSGILARGLFSIVVTYLVVAALSIGTVITFTLGGIATQSESTSTYIGVNYETDNFDPVTGRPKNITCLPPTTQVTSVPRFDYYWGVLAANPYVVLADAAAGDFDADGNPRDLFSSLAYGVRSAQIAPELDTVYDECAHALSGYPETDYPSAKEIMNTTVPSWFVGLVIHLALAAGALVWAVFRTRTPAGRMVPGNRIA